MLLRLWGRGKLTKTVVYYRQARTMEAKLFHHHHKCKIPKIYKKGIASSTIVEQYFILAPREKQKEEEYAVIN